MKATYAAPGADMHGAERWEHVDRLLTQVGDEHLAALEGIVRLSDIQQELDCRIFELENSLLFGLLRRAGRQISAWRARSGQVLLRSPLHGIYRRVFTPGFDPAYRLWSQREEIRLTERYKVTVVSSPVITLLMAVHNPQRPWLSAAIQSIRRQFYGGWQLSICDDCSPEGWVLDYLREHARTDGRITVCRAPYHGGISRALNLAGRSAAGEYVAAVGQEDVLPPYALAAVAEAAASGDPDVLYTDEDRLDESGERCEPVFKPGWSPHLLLSSMYAGRLLAVARHALGDEPWFRPECDGGHDHDLLLRLADRPLNVRHVPHVLYHRRKHSEAGNTHDAGKRAVQDALERRGWPATVEDGPRPNCYGVRVATGERPLVSIIICTRTLRLFRKCIRKLESRTDYRPFEVVAVQHLTGDDGRLTAFMERAHAVRVPYNGPYNAAVMNNAGAAAARGEVFVFLNDDIVPLRRDWLERLVEGCRRPGVGVAGAKLTYPAGTIQHAGITLGLSDGCGHVARGECAAAYWPWLEMARDVSAVTGACLAIPRSVFQEVGGFRAIFPTNYGDVDLCLRVRARGLGVLVDPKARLEHVECGTRMAGTQYAEREAWRREWRSAAGVSEDPFYSPNLARSETVRLRSED